MRTVKCKNCGASFGEDMAQCPYCGTMNKRGAYMEFRLKISDMIDSLLGLKDDVQRSVSSIILRAFLRSLILIAVIVGIAFVTSRFVNVNHYNDKEYDQEAMEEIIWLDENLDRLNEAYERGDYKAVEKIYYENSRAASGWVLYPEYCLKKGYKEFEEAARLDFYQLQKALYLIFYPSYYTGYNGMSRVDDEVYDQIRTSVIEYMKEKGYEYSELEEIYKACSDSYGYIDSSLIKNYVKEDGNGKL